MSGETVRTHAHFIGLGKLFVTVLFQSTAHHPPANRTLRGSETEQSSATAIQLLGQFLAQQEVSQRETVGEPNHSAEHAVAVFPDENGLEVVQGLQ